MSGNLRDALIASITEHALNVVSLAQTMIEHDLDERVPVADEQGGTLRDSRVSRFDQGPTTMGIEISYPVDYAEYTDRDTAPHRIDGPLSFFWKEVGAWVIVPRRPLPGGPAFWTSDGTLIIGKGYIDHPGTTGTYWWSDIVSEDYWADTLILAAESVG